ncbi:arsenic resistance protein [Arenimonas sp.]|uniref:arsenic resistance protein n=1 Tax=Arenimonas sp. TaxID=1872635 RepID=UPI0025BDDDE1|nr:arsenic resistance protein [Arenimonas sp.]
MLFPVRRVLEHRQVPIYLGAVLLAVTVAVSISGTQRFQGAITPALALMLYVTFLQVPLAKIGQPLRDGRFLGALLTANFVAVPLLVAGLMLLAPADPLVRLGLLLVLLTPCIDYVVTFSHMGRANAQGLLAATPLLLVLQMLLLPVYLRLLMGEAAANLVAPGPFLHAFLWLIAVPLLLASLTQWWAASTPSIARVACWLAVLPVPATAIVLFVVVAAVVPQLGEAGAAVWHIAPLYVAFAVAAPMLGWAIATLFRLQAASGRAVAFSAGTRNSLVVLPLGLAIPHAMPMLPAVIVLQTLIELLAELVYVRWIARWGDREAG